MSNDIQPYAGKSEYLTVLITLSVKVKICLVRIISRKDL